MKIQVCFVAAVGVGVFKIYGNWAFQIPFIIIVFATK